MKILLLGEFSGVHTNLKEGLEALGHSVTLASSGDSYKNFQGDFNYAPKKNNKLYRVLFKIIFLLLTIKKLYHYVVVQIIAPNIFVGEILNLNHHNLMKLKKHSKAFF